MPEAAPSLSDDGLFWLLVVPAIVMWLYVVVDIAIRPGVGRLARVVWVAAVTVALPAALLWLLVRPTGDPVRARLAQIDASDPRAQLVDLVQDHDAGRVDDATFERRRDDLLQVSGGTQPRP